MKSFGRLRILKQLDESGTDSYLVHDPERGREILLHVLPAERTETNRSLWERLDRALPVAGDAVLDSGDVLGVRYVLTEPAPQFSSLITFLESATKPDSTPVKPTEEPGSFTKIFNAKIAPVSNSKAEPGEVGAFTRMFQGAPANAPQSLEETASMPMRALQSTTAAESAKEAGAFTRMFQPAAPPKPPEKVEPGINAGESEFSRMFRAPVDEPKPTPVPSPLASIDAIPLPIPLSENDRTRLFAAPQPRLDQPRPEQPRSEQKPQPRSKPEEAKPEDFGKFSQSPLEARKSDVDFSKLPTPQPPPLARPAGEFTRMFGKPFAAEPQKRAAGARQEVSGATGVFAKLKAPQFNSPSPPAVNTGPSEYTRMFGGQRMKALAEPTAVSSSPANPPASGVQQKLPAAGPPVLLFVLLGVLAILAIALILYFVLKH